MLSDGISLEIDGMQVDNFSLLTDMNEYTNIEDYEAYIEQNTNISDMVDQMKDNGSFSADSTYYENLENYDPATSDSSDVTGDPEDAMEVWEWQGDTNRCALYSQKFIIEEFTGHQIDIEEFADVAEANGWFTETDGTPITHMNKMLDYCGIENETSDFNTIDDMKDCLEDGGRVIVAIDADEYWYGENDDMFIPNDGPNHAVEVIGIDESDPENPQVILNDSGLPDGAGKMVPLDTFIDAWEDSNNYMISVYG